MEAMATGMPVILPKKFEEVFEDGAIYVDPADVYSVVSRLWGDRMQYMDQVQKGWDYIDRTCASANFSKRISHVSSLMR